MNNRYSKQDYDNLLKQYREKKNNSVISSVLTYLASYEIPDDDRDSFFFLNDLIKLVKENNDSKSELQIREVANRMKNTSGSSMMRMVVLANSVKTETDCIELIEECFKNDMYEYALDSIVECISRHQKISIAVKILKTIGDRPEETRIADKNRIACQFIDRVDQMLKKDAVIKRETGLLGKYYSVKWDDFFDKDYKKYLSLREKFKNDKVRVKKEESQRQKDKKLAKEQKAQQKKKEAERKAQQAKPITEIKPVKRFPENCILKEKAGISPVIKLYNFADFIIKRVKIENLGQGYEWTFHCKFDNYSSNYLEYIRNKYSCYVEVSGKGFSKRIELTSGNWNQVFKISFTDKSHSFCDADAEITFNFDISRVGKSECTYLAGEKRFMH